MHTLGKPDRKCFSNMSWPRRIWKYTHTHLHMTDMLHRNSISSLSFNTLGPKSMLMSWSFDITCVLCLHLDGWLFKPTKGLGMCPAGGLCIMKHLEGAATSPVWGEVSLYDSVRCEMLQEDGTMLMATICKGWTATSGLRSTTISFIKSFWNILDH